MWNGVHLNLPHITAPSTASILSQARTDTIGLPRLFHMCATHLDHVVQVLRAVRRHVPERMHDGRHSQHEQELQGGRSGGT